MARLLGIDIGTSATKAVLIDESGNVMKSASSEYPLLTPQPGWAEQNANDWVNAVQKCLAEIGEKRPDAIGLTGQMHGLVPLDAADVPIRNALLWCDQRTASECDDMERVLGSAAIRSNTCNPPMTGFQAPKLLWFKKNEPDAFSKVKSALLPKDYLRLVLTGDKATDVSDASGTGLFNVPERKWWAEAMEKLGLSPDLFPRAIESASVTGVTTRSQFLEAGVPVVAGAGDQAASAVSTGAVEPGVVSLSLGTSGVVFVSEDAIRPPSGRPINTFCHANGRWHSMGVMLSCGGAVRWARDTFFGDLTFSEMDRLASLSSVGASGVSFLPYLTGERCPHNDPGAKGAFAGLSLSTARQDLARAVIEGVSFGLKGCFEALCLKPDRSLQVRVTGGGSISGVWMQILADVLNVECVPLEGECGPAVGAAVLAGVGIGVWPSVASASRGAVVLGKSFEPSGADYGRACGRFESLYPALKAWE